MKRDLSAKKIDELLKNVKIEEASQDGEKADEYRQMAFTIINSRLRKTILSHNPGTTVDTSLDKIKATIDAVNKDIEDLTKCYNGIKSLGFLR